MGKKNSKSNESFGMEVVGEGSVGHLRHKECYLGIKEDNIFFAFIPDPEIFTNKDLGKLGQLALEKGLTLEKATTLSASELFDRQLRGKTLFDKDE